MMSDVTYYILAVRRYFKISCTYYALADYIFFFKLNGYFITLNILKFKLLNVFIFKSQVAASAQKESRHYWLCDPQSLRHKL